MHISLSLTVTVCLHAVYQTRSRGETQLQRRKRNASRRCKVEGFLAHLKPGVIRLRRIPVISKRGSFWTSKMQQNEGFKAIRFSID